MNKMTQKVIAKEAIIAGYLTVENFDENGFFSHLLLSLPVYLDYNETANCSSDLSL